MSCQVQRRRLTNLANAQRKQKARQGRGFALFQRRQQVVGRLLSHPLEAQQLLFLQGEQISHIGHQTLVNQLINQFVAKALDIHCTARGEVA